MMPRDKPLVVLGRKAKNLAYAANIHDTKSGIKPALHTFERYPSIKKFCADAGYRGAFVVDMRVSEHPFGTAKWYDGAHYFLCRGKKKTAAEASLMFLSYNIRRAITLAGGVPNLIHRMREALTRMRPRVRFAHLTEMQGDFQRFFKQNGVESR